MLRFLVSLFVVVTSAGENTGKKDVGGLFTPITLQSEAVLVITAWQGSQRCDEGEIYLIEPSPKVVSPYQLPTKKSSISGWDMIFDHLPKGRETIVLGPYHDDTAVRFGFRLRGEACNRNFSSSEDRVRITQYSAEHYFLSIEDNQDKDYNDLFLELIIKPIPAANTISTSVTAVEAFNNPTNYQHPWPTGQNYQITTQPGQGHHIGRAFDFAMKKGDPILASEQGIVLWIEDSFGNGSCNLSQLGKSNVIVIQTEEGVNQNYLHLAQNSVKEAGIKVGDIVQKGQFIGRAGNSGYVCSRSGGDGTHLHLEWVHNCYDVEGSRKKRQRYSEGKPTLTWNCPNLSADAPFSFN